MSQKQPPQAPAAPVRQATASSVTAFNLAARHADNLAKFTEKLAAQRFRQILPAGETLAEKAIGFLDSQTCLIYPPASVLRAFLDLHPFVEIQKGGKTLATLQVATRLLWTNDSSTEEYALNDGRKVVEEGRWAELTEWQLPSKDQLYAFATANNNPHRNSEAYRLRAKGDASTYAWLTSQGRANTDSSNWGISESSGWIFACHPFFQNFSDHEILVELSSRGWTLSSPNGQTVSPHNPDIRWQSLSPEARLLAMQKEGIRLLSVSKSGEEKPSLLDPANYSLRNQLISLDHTPCRLPELDNAQLSDPEKGLWELWGEDEEAANRFGIVARDPDHDIQHRAVAIDFGTSSTVVACETNSGGRELLRIGVRDFFQAVQPQHFENPTVLECLDFSAFRTAWTARAYRPELDWNWVHAAHEAQASFRDNPGDTGILASILPRLKQWALRSDRNRVCLTDRKGQEIKLAPHSERNPVRGQPLAVSTTDPFDPIELYAWYLGMAINWRGRGLFLKYYLSFPVKYPREVRERILASFRRGLQRSLPQSLITHHPQVLNTFEVNDLASEPAAYAAAALEHLGVEPDDVGVPYAVFDFGGGTTDFDFGLLRWANDEEDVAGYEQVFEHLASSGDNHLGGENLLEHLVYETFHHNLDVLRKEKIQFALPLDAQPFVGSEAFIARTQAAQTNTVMLAARLRSFMEGDAARLEPQIKLDLIDADGNKKTCELILDAEHLDEVLAERMRRGVEAFLAELAHVHPELPPDVPVHILLAGNGSRSRHIHTLFDTEGEHWPKLLHLAFGDSPPEIIIHPPLPMDDQNPHAPTSKTGVALGLLRVSPGRNVLLQNHVHAHYDGQAPFGWFAGRLRRGCLEPTLTPGTNYGEWKALGPLQSGVFYLYATSSPRAHSGLQEGDPELKMHRLEFPAAPAGARVCARAVAPHVIELSAVLESDDPANGEHRRFDLE